MGRENARASLSMPVLQFAMVNAPSCHPMGYAISYFVLLCFDWFLVCLFCFAWAVAQVSLSNDCVDRDVRDLTVLMTCFVDPRRSSWVHAPYWVASWGRVKGES